MHSYLEAISIIEKLHWSFLDVIKLELDSLGIQDINNTQSMMLFNIGDSEMTVGELTVRGCYLGSNVSYNVRKMVENGYLVQERSVHDRRSIRVHLTEKGSTLSGKLVTMHQRHVELLLDQPDSNMTREDLKAATVTLRRLERFWMRACDLHTIGPLLVNAASQPIALPDKPTTGQPAGTRPVHF